MQHCPHCWHFITNPFLKSGGIRDEAESYHYYFRTRTRFHVLTSAAVFVARFFLAFGFQLSALSFQLSADG